MESEINPAQPTEPERPPKDRPAPERVATTPRVVGIQFDGSDHVEYVTFGRIKVEIGDDVVIANRRGRRIGMVVTRPRHATSFEAQRGLARVQRLAEAGDVQRTESTRTLENDQLVACVRIVRKQNLKMKVITAEQGNDGRLTVFFAADERPDMREVSRMFSQELRTRVELKEVSPRDEAKVIGAAGPCGRELCCSTFLRAPGGVSLKMAKAQGLSPHPSRLAGMCGRLKCCLKYEYDTYLGLGKQLPAIGSSVMSVKGDGTVVRQNLLAQKVVLRDRDGAEVEASLEDLVDKKPPNRRAADTKAPDTSNS